MAPLLTTQTDTHEVLAAFDGLGQAIQPPLLMAAQTTARAIAREAQARVRRRTGQTATGIKIELAQRGLGYVVFVENPDNPGLPGWIEFGTIHQVARGFFFAPARLEEGAHYRRIVEAINAAIAEVSR